MYTRTMATIGLTLIGCLLGCASVEPQEGFGDVARTVETRTPEQVVWRTGGPEDDEADQAVAELLDQPLTSDAAAQIALLNNRRLQATYELLGIAQADLVQAGLLSNPVFSASITFPIDGGASRPNLGIAQSFLDIFFVPLRERVAKAALVATQQRVADQVIEHAARTRAALYRVQADMQTVTMLEQIAEETREALEVVHELREAGQVGYIDVRNKEALLEQARMDLRRAESELELSRERATVLMGLKGEGVRWEAEPRLPDLPEEEAPVAELQSAALERSLELAAIRAEVDAAGGRIDLAEASALLPTGDVGMQAQRRSGVWNVGPQLSLPLPIFDQGQAVRAEAEARLRQQQHVYEAATIEVRSAARTAAHRVQIAREVTDHYRDILLPLREEIYEDSLLQYNALNISILDLITVRQQQMDTEREYIEAIYDYWVARTQLDQVLAGSTSSLAPAVVE